MDHRPFAVWLCAIIKRHQTLLIAIGLGVAFFFLQLLFINEYGVSWDEPLHRSWGKIFYLFLRTGDRHLLELMPGSGIYYGPVYYLANFLLSEKLYQAHLFLFVAANHLLNLLMTSSAVAFVFLLGERIAGRRIGLLATLFFVLFPPLIAHAHYNPKDIPLMTALLVTAYAFTSALQSPSRKLFLLAGFLLGLSIALKVSAILMLPVFGLTYLLWLGQKGTALPMIAFLRRETITMLLATLMIILGMIVAWPSAWTDLMLIPRSIRFFLGTNFWPGKVLFFGQEYGGAGLPWTYIPLEYLTAMPLLTTLSLAGGMIVALCSLASPQRFASSTLLLLWIAIPILVSLKPGLVRYDGMRQFFFCLPAIAIIAALGFDHFLRFIERRMSRLMLASGITCAVLALSLVHEVALLHPFEGSYRNEIVRLLIPEAIDRQMEIEYWGPSYLQGMTWLIENAERNPVICVPIAGILVTWYPWREDFTFECSDRSTYVMFFTRYSEARTYAELNISPVFTIQRMHSDLLKIYKIK